MTKLVLPVDVTVADRFDAEAVSQVVAVAAVPAGWRILDIGPRTLEHLSGAPGGCPHRGLERAHGRL